MSVTLPSLALILGVATTTATVTVAATATVTATALPYPPNYSGMVRVMKRGSGFSEEGGGFLPQDVTLKSIKTSRSAIIPSCWFQYYTTCPRSSWLPQEPRSRGASLWSQLLAARGCTSPALWRWSRILAARSRAGPALSRWSQVLAAHGLILMQIQKYNTLKWTRSTRGHAGPARPDWLEPPVSLGLPQLNSVRLF